MKKQNESVISPIERVELHCHTKMSAMDGIVSATDLINHAKSLGHTAVAITDYGCVQAFPEAYRASQETGVKVIYGVDVYLKTTGDSGALFKVTLLVKNQIGLKNLYKLISKALTDNYKIRPIVLDTDLKNCREGLLVGSACTHGELQYDILHRYNYDKFLEIAEFYDYFEVHPNEDKQIVETLIKLGDELNKPVVATGDVHYLHLDEYIFRSILKYGRGVYEGDEEPTYFFRTTEEMLEAFYFLGTEKAFEIVVNNTTRIEDMIEDISPIPVNGLYYPEIDGAEEELMEISKARFRELYDENPQGEASKRLYREFNGININGFASTYMIAKRLVDYVANKGYQISTRGSAGSSFIAYLLGITDINPLEYDIPFDVFAGCKKNDISGAEYRKTPDFGFNLCSDGQRVAIKYLEEMLGTDKIIKAGTIETVNYGDACIMLLGYCDDNEISTDSLDNKILSNLRGVKKL